MYIKMVHTTYICVCQSVSHNDVTMLHMPMPMARDNYETNMSVYTRGLSGRRSQTNISPLCPISGASSQYQSRKWIFIFQDKLIDLIWEISRTVIWLNWITRDKPPGCIHFSILTVSLPFSNKPGQLFRAWYDENWKSGKFEQTLNMRSECWIVGPPLSEDTPGVSG